ncbi:MAG: GNAT family N-acetyltransferase [Gemmatimonadota bacterium]
MTGSGYILETTRLGLRRFVADDAARVASTFEDDAARRFYPDMHRLEHAERWVRRNLDRYDIDGIGLWAVIEKETGAFAGDAGLMYQPLDGTREVEVGYHIHAAFRGRGFATEAAAACMAHGFELHGFPRIISLVHPDNEASKRVASRIHSHVRPGQHRGMPHLIYCTEKSRDGGRHGAGDMRRATEAGDRRRRASW